jgi:hypothetical protein
MIFLTHMPAPRKWRRTLSPAAQHRLSKLRSRLRWLSCGKSALLSRTTLLKCDMSVNNPRILISDTSPISLLGLYGPEALDWFFVLDAEVWITDMVRYELIREPDDGSDRRVEHRRVLADWFIANQYRIHVQVTAEGLGYEREMRNWIRGGSVIDDKPLWRDRGEISIRQTLDVVRHTIENDESVFILCDDGAARALISEAVQNHGLRATLMGTQSFLALLEQEYGVQNSLDTWKVIQIAANNKAPRRPNPDPLYFPGES